MTAPWMDKALCRHLPAELFDPDTYTSDIEVTHAAAVCAQCPVRAQCLDYATKHEPNTRMTITRGMVYGGTTPRQRSAAYDRRIRAAGRKDEAA